MEMKYCMHCGSRLDEKYLMGEGMVPYCPDCGEFRFPVYRTAVSVIVMNLLANKSIDTGTTWLALDCGIIFSW